MWLMMSDERVYTHTNRGVTKIELYYRQCIIMLFANCMQRDGDQSESEDHRTPNGRVA